MRWSIKIARIAGTEVRIHVTFLLLLAWVGFVYYRQGGPAAAVDGVLFLLLLFGCVLLHEFGHALAARRFGIPTPDITLLPIGGVARLQRMPDQPRQELIVALAGPAVNVVIAAVLLWLMARPGDAFSWGPLTDHRAGLVPRLAWVNIVLVVFNLIPAFPMDGGRVLRALLAMRMNYARATQIAAAVGQGIAFLFGFIGLFSNPLLVFVALFVYLGASQEAAVAQIKDLARGLLVSEAMVTHFAALPADATVDEAAAAVVQSYQHEFPVLDARGRVVGMLTQDAIIRALRTQGPQTPVRDVMHTGVPVVRVDESFERAFQLMQESRCPALPVVGYDGRLLGLVTPESVGEMMMMQAVLSRGSGPAWHPTPRYRLYP
ncbi:MAG: CBS domain-containing protein [Bacteroidetes bacterium]|nr:MAG: CBS domain-containing protein [Bacteroidota bacterium]